PNTSAARGPRAGRARAAPRSVVVAGEYPRNAPRERVYVDRLGDEGSASRSQRVGSGLQARVGGHRDDWDGCGRGHALQEASQRQPILTRKLEVHEDHRRGHGLEAVQGLAGGARDLDLVARRLEHCPHEELVRGVVFDDEDQRLPAHVPLSVASVLVSPAKGTWGRRKARTWLPNARVSIGLDM